ncbi:hypothetical protein [Candidatus Regiella insecticola]|nr:hypothetical protein [Candidatus Regiella insecticola]
MTKEVQISIKMEPELRDQFRAATALHHRPAAQVMRELMRHYISNTQIPNALTADTLRKSKKGEEVSKAVDSDDLFKQLDI